MDTLNIPSNIPLIALKAESFPAGISPAFNKLRSLLPEAPQRTLYGYSHGGKNGIVYYAAATELFPGEHLNYKCQFITIPSGTYFYKILPGDITDPDRIGKTFEQLLWHPDIDPQGACIEWYKNADELVCMVKQAP